ncbi:hypothetical protein FACS189443_0040 [Planctomycetales bacterium]|nr:hypothetical protein FACS189443_0040 [Planctomycetales bacterium]
MFIIQRFYTAVLIVITPACVLALSCLLEAQQPIGYAPTGLPPQIPVQQTQQNNTVQNNLVITVNFQGNSQVSTADILKMIKMRQGRPFSETTLEEDKRTLMQKRCFLDVKTKVERTPDGFIVTFQFIELPLLNYTKIVGPQHHTRKTLLEEGNLKVGDAQDPIAVHQAAERMEQFYHESGYDKVHIEVLSGDEIGDRGATFLVSEGSKQRILSIEFEGNQITTAGRLKTLVKSKPGWFLWINSEFTRKQLDEDVETLTNYYRKLGFFYAKVDRVFEETEGYTGLGERRNWVKVKFIIDEGPRCKIRDIRFVGNHVFQNNELLKVMKTAKTKDKYFNQDMVEIDMQKIKERYGDEGYVFAMPMPDPRVDQDSVDLVINIKEGPRCYLNTLNIEIVGNDGGESYTKWQPILNRSSLRPGDVLRTTEINATKRRLAASQLFNTNPTQGVVPEIIFNYPKEALEEEAAAAQQDADEILNAERPQIRGQSPQNFQPQVIPAKEIPTKKVAQPNMIIRGQAISPATNPMTFGSIAPTQDRFAIAPTRIPVVPVNTANTNAPISAPANLNDVAQNYSASNYSQNNQNSNSQNYVPQQQTAQNVGNGVLYNQGNQGGMVFTQYRVDNAANPATATPQPVFLGNPYDPLAESNIRLDPNAPPGVSPKIFPTDAIARVQETRTGQLMMSVAVSSDAGLMGRFVLEEQNFDITNLPKGWRLNDWKNAFRGKGQRFRLEAVPGTEVQRYSASWETPYIFDWDYSFGVSGFYYQRYYDEWYENRLGGSLSFGKLWTPDFSTRLSLGAQEVKIRNGMIPAIIPYLGKHPMYTVGLSATHNTRDSEYMPTEGHLLSAGIEQVLGDYQFLRGNVDVRQYFMLRERPDRSGRWVLGLRSSLSVAETNAPTYEKYFGGGYTSIRGFDFRGISPRDRLGYITGGAMEFYNSAEMIFPLTADDMVRGSLFIDTGTVERTVSKWEDDYRAAVGFGLRLTIPMMGPAPIALDFAFPISKSTFDQKQIFSFNVGFMR